MDLSSLTFFDILLIIVAIVVITYFSIKTGSGPQKSPRKRQNLRKHESDRELIADKAKNASGDQEGLFRSRSLIGRP